MILLIFLVSLVYGVAACAWRNHGLVSPLDDAYITYQYARQIARGQPYRYNAADVPTTGMTSPLFGFILAGFYRLGVTGPRLPALGIGLGLVWLSLIVWLTYRLGLSSAVAETPVGRRRWALLTAALALLAGSVQWGSFNGMETGFYTVLTLAALTAYLNERLGWAALWLGLAGLTRPGGFVLAVALAGTELLTGLGRSRSVRWRRLAPLSLAVVSGLVPSFVNWTLTGTSSSAALQAKSWLYNVPRYPDEAVRTIWWTYRRMLRQFAGLAAPAHWLIAPGALALALVGWVQWARQARWRTLLATGGWFLGGTLALSTLITATWHQGRYLAPFVPLVAVVATTGLSSLYAGAGQRWQRGGVIALALLLVALSVVSTVRYASLYRRSVRTMSRQHVTVAQWMRDHLPPDARVGLADAGILRYVGQRPTYDVVGLTTPNAAAAWRHGPGSEFEQMEHSSMRPDYFATQLPYFTATDIYAEELFSVTLDDHFGSANQTLGVWQADWTLAGSGDRFYQPDVLSHTAGLEVVDTLDVADLADESAHRVSWWENERRGGFATEMQQFAYRVLPEREVIDGGRLLTGGIAFDVATRPGESLWLVARLHAQQPGAVRVLIDGADAGRWAYPQVAGEWLESVFRVPAEMISQNRTRIALQVDTDDPAFRYYAPYTIWCLQGEPRVDEVTVGHEVGARFGESIALLGFDLPQGTWHPGDVVPLVLYWQAQQGSTVDAKVFVHLYDREGALGPQSDGYPYHGTRPPYTWRPGEVVADPRSIALPGDLAPGTYTVAVGLYRPDGDRLVARLGGMAQTENWIVLTQIEVEE